MLTELTITIKKTRHAPMMDGVLIAVSEGQTIKCSWNASLFCFYHHYFSYYYDQEKVESWFGRNSRGNLIISKSLMKGFSLMFVLTIPTNKIYLGQRFAQVQIKS